MNNSDVITTLGRNIRYWRERRGISLATLGVTCGKAISEIEALEEGRLEVLLDDLQTISDLLDVQIKDLFAETCEQMPECVVETDAV